VRTSVGTACYVFGIVDASAPLPAAGIRGGPATDLRLVEANDLKAVVGTLAANRQLGRASDLIEHDRVLAELVAAGAAVLPMRFGAVLTDEAAVVDELLGAHAEEFRAELEAIRGRVQYTVKVRYVQDTVLREVLTQYPDIDRLRQNGSFDARLRLGEMVVHALELLRPDDAAALMDELDPAVDVYVHETVEPEEVLNAAILVERRGSTQFESRIEEIGRRHYGRMRIRLVGPSPVYDFVGSR
jgi:hypothetical protein